MSKLTPRQEKCALRYLECSDATESYQYAYSCARMKRSTITRRAFDVIHLPKVQAFLDENREAAQKRTGITVDRVLNEYGRLAFNNLPDIVNFSKGSISITDFENLSTRQKACIKKFKVTTEKRLDTGGKPTMVDKVEIELHDKLHALDSIAKHLGMFIDRSEIKTTDDTALKTAKELFKTMTTQEKEDWLAKQTSK